MQIVHGFLSKKSNLANGSPIAEVAAREKINEAQR
jgi:hypothetical protein